MGIALDNIITLRSGLRLGYAEYGDPEGHPVIGLHGLPSCRWEHLTHADEIERSGVRLVAPDRPGIGLSDWRPYTIADYPDDVVELADQLGLERFGVIGVSSGPKFVLACAWKIASRLTGATAVSGTGPFDLRGVKEAYQPPVRRLYAVAAWAPVLFRLGLAKLARDLRRNPEPEAILGLFGDAPEVDRKAFNRPGSIDLVGNMLEALRQGTRGAAHDFHLEARPWGFDVREIEMPVQFFHGALDSAAPVEASRILADALPNASYREYPEDGHSLFLVHPREFLSTVI